VDVTLINISVIYRMI